MADKTVRVRRRRRPRTDEVKAEVEEVEEDDVEETEDEEEVEEAPRARRTERRRRREVKEVEETEDEDAEEEEPVVEEAPRARRRTKAAEEAVPEVAESEEEEEAKPVRRAKKVDVGGRHGDRTMTVEEMEEKESEPDPEPVNRLPKSIEILMKDAFLTDVMAAMTDGQTLLITRKNETTWEMRSTDSNGKLLVADKDSSPKLRGKEYWDEVLNPKWKEWADEWNTLTFDERKAYAKKNKIKWDDHESERIAKMNLGTAVVSHLGIEKYKEQYRTAAARRAVKA